jgi:hypothetical protein
MIQHPSRSFALEITLDLIKGTEFFCLKPALHFHVQEEYIESVQGKIDLELDGKEHVLSAGDRPMSIRPYVNHRSYPLPLARQDDGETVMKFLLSGEKTDSLFELNPVFFRGLVQVPRQCGSERRKDLPGTAFECKPLFLSAISSTRPMALCPVT